MDEAQDGTKPDLGSMSLAQMRLRMEQSRKKIPTVAAETTSVAAAAPVAPAPTAAHPTKTWAEKIALSAKAVPRGVMDAAGEIGTTIGEGAAFVDRKTGLGEAIQPGFNAAYDDVGAQGLAAPIRDSNKEQTDAIFGKRSDDGLANFVESASQFMTGFAITGELKLASGAATLAKLGGANTVVSGAVKAGIMMARGAAVDATTFNPFESGLAELAARAPIGMVSDFGKALSVKNDDPWAMARLKRATMGLVPMAILEGAGATVRASRAWIAARAGDTGAEATIRSEIDRVASMEHGGAVPDSHVKVVQTADDEWTLVARDSKDSVEEALKGDSPKFSDPAEAAQQGASVDAHINDIRNAGKIDEDGVTMLTEAAKTPDELVQAVSNPPLEVPLGNTVEDNLALVKSLSEKWSAFIAAEEHGATGSVSIQKTFDLLAEDIGHLPNDVSHPVVKALLKDTAHQSVATLAARVVGQRLARQSIALMDAMVERPHDPLIGERLIKSVQAWGDLRDALRPVESESGRVLRLIREKVRAVVMGDGGDVSAAATKEAAAAAKTITLEEAVHTARLFKLTDGAPRDMKLLEKTLKIAASKESDAWDKAFTYYVNGLLSGPKTLAAIAVSGATMSHFEPMLRMMAGAETRNSALFREGADLMWGNYKYFLDNVSGMAKAFREGRSLFNPMPLKNVQLPVGDMVAKMPSRVLVALDEFTRLSNYRSKVRAMSLRNGRASGLIGDALDLHVEKDLAAAFDRNGVAQVPEALTYAQQATFSGDLVEGTLGAGLQQFANNHFEARYVMPFIKASANIFDYSWKMTPLLNQVNKSYQIAMKAGGEQAAIATARTQVGATVYAAAAYAAMNGQITGRPPADPSLRKTWLTKYQPYSVHVGNNADGSPNWISYRKVEPFSTLIGSVADASVAFHEMDEHNVDGQNLAAALVSSIVANVDNKSYMQGITDFFQEFMAGDTGKMNLWMNKQAGSMVPNVLNTMNPDGTIREVRNMADAVLARIPGWSDRVDPKFNFMGEPVSKVPGLFNRSVNPFTVKDGGKPADLEQALIELDKGMPTYPFVKDGADLTDRKTYDNGTGVSPYRRMMELVGGADGGTPLRKQLESLVESPGYQSLTGSTKMDGFTDLGGTRWDMIAHLKTVAENAAWAKVQQEYPKLAMAIVQTKTLKAAGHAGGANVATSLMEMFKKK